MECLDRHFCLCISTKSLARYVLGIQHDNRDIAAFARRNVVHFLSIQQSSTGFPIDATDAQQIVELR